MGLRVASADPTRRQYRLAVLSRCMAAFAGGYAAMAAATVCLSLALPIARSEAVVLASLGSCPIYVACIVWSFAARSATRAWVGLTLVAGLALLSAFAVS